MAGVASSQNHYSKIMEYVIIRKTEVIGDISLPRPKIVKDVVFRGPLEEAQSHLSQLEKLSQNQSTDIISCELKIEKYKGQKSNTSSRPGNGTRQLK